MTPGVVDKDPAHRPCGEGKEMGPIVEPGIPLIGQLQVGLVDQRSSGKRVTRCLRPEASMCQSAQLGVDSWEQGVQLEAGRLGVGAGRSHRGRTLRSGRTGRSRRTRRTKGTERTGLSKEAVVS